MIDLWIAITRLQVGVNRNPSDPLSSVPTDIDSASIGMPSGVASLWKLNELADIEGLKDDLSAAHDTVSDLLDFAEITGESLAVKNEFEDLMCIFEDAAGVIFHRSQKTILRKRRMSMEHSE